VIRQLTIFAISITFFELAQSSEVIVCSPVELTYKAASSDLTIYSKNGITSDDSGVLCNNSRSWCKSITMRPAETINIHVGKTNFSKEMIFYQTKYDSKVNYGGCKWRVNM
jgi:hypothetical protein